MDFNRIVELTAEYIKLHPYLSCLVLFSWSFLETALLLGLILPAEKGLIVGSILVSEGVISPYSFVFCVTFGTFLGYTLSYFAGGLLGKEFLGSLLKRFNVSEENVEKTRKFIEEKGELSLLVGRFLPIVRATLPLVIGTFKPDFLKFSLLNFLGALLWAVSYLFLGNLIKEAFSLIINHKALASFILPFSVVAYLLWRKYGKDKKLF